VVGAGAQIDEPIHHHAIQGDSHRKRPTGRAKRERGATKEPTIDDPIFERS